MSVIATAVRHLLAAGVTGEDLVSAIADMEASLPGDAVAEKRRAYDRERKRALKSTGIPPEPAESTELPPALDKESVPQTPFKEINLTPRARAAGAQGIILPDGWKPAKLSRETVSGQIIETRGQDWAKRALETFENHWRSKSGKDARKRDWQGTWANWVIEQDRRDGRQSRPANDGTGLGINARAGIAVFGAPG